MDQAHQSPHQALAQKRKKELRLGYPNRWEVELGTEFVSLELLLAFLGVIGFAEH